MGSVRDGWAREVAGPGAIQELLFAGLWVRPREIVQAADGISLPSGAAREIPTDPCADG